jgi:hypothetical protein
MKRKLLKPLLGCLLAAALLACAKTEEVAAQGKQKGKTVKEVLCKKWHLEGYFKDFRYSVNDTFSIEFYSNNTFVFYTDPKMQNGVSLIKGTWALETKEQENFPCYESEGFCWSDIKIKFFSYSIVQGGYCEYMFSENRYSRIGHLYRDILIVYPPITTHYDNRSFYFSVK